jgi:hypothetical protein
MQNHGPSQTLRLVEADCRAQRVLHNPRALRDFTRVCEAAGILDPDTGLIRSPQRGEPYPSS